MKKLIEIIAAVIILIIITTNSVFGSKAPFDTTDFVVNGIIIKTNKKLDSKCKLELYYENKVIDSTIVNLDKPFEFKLKKNVWYTIRVTKEGFLPLMISIDTQIGKEDYVTNNLFSFETELIDEQRAKYLNKDVIDFPVGLVSYNKDTKKFEARDVYTNNYMAALYLETKEVLDVAVENSTLKKDPLTADIAKENITKKMLGKDMC